jgi:mono/diheme cytochrome c family protein
VGIVRKVLLSALAIVAVAIVAAFVYIEWGVYNVAATRQHTRPVYDALREALRRSVAHHAKDIRAPQFDASDVNRGLAEYQRHCTRCHGAPGVAPEEFALGMAPLPTNLVHAARTSTPEEIYWAIKHGIKMTGMPAWEYRLDDHDLWALTAFITRALPRMSPAEYSERLGALSRGPELTQTGPSGAASQVGGAASQVGGAASPVSGAASQASSAASQVDRDLAARDSGPQSRPFRLPLASHSGSPPPLSRGATGGAAGDSAEPEAAGFAALPPVLGDPARGARAIPQYGCTTCHRVPGVLGRRTNIGPPLRGIAARSYLGGVLPNTPGNMVRWLLDPQAIEPHSLMPNLGLTTRDAADIAAYLETLDRP